MLGYSGDAAVLDAIFGLLVAHEEGSSLAAAPGGKLTAAVPQAPPQPPQTPTPRLVRSNTNRHARQSTPDFVAMRAQTVSDFAALAAAAAVAPPVYHARVGFDELYEWLKGKRHSLDRRGQQRQRHTLAEMRFVTRSALGDRKLRALDWDCATGQQAGGKGEETLRIEIQRCLKAYGYHPADLVRRWDKDGDGSISRHELLIAMKPLVGDDIPLWDSAIRGCVAAVFERLVKVSSTRAPDGPKRPCLRARSATSSAPCAAALRALCAVRVSCACCCRRASARWP